MKVKHSKLISIINSFIIIRAFVDCFISSISGPFMFVYSILRTIDGMTENIQHISNSMDLSLQSFLSNQIVINNTIGTYAPLIINADYHGSVSPFVIEFHPTLPNFKLKLENEINDEFLEKNEFSNNCLSNYTINQFHFKSFVGMRSNSENTYNSTDDFKIELVNNTAIGNERYELVDPHYYNANMINKNTINLMEKNTINEITQMSKLVDPLFGYYTNQILSAAPTTLRYSEYTISENGIYQYKQGEFQNTEAGANNVDIFRLYTYYTTHYLFQITSIFSMGISLHSQYRRKSRQRKLHLVR
ncbi:putative secreted protein, signal peptide, possible transmembrane domain near C-terminus [Cryptosporidium felis]|nr:putative secreted protein, signal peptide, possible transmembrane domain near C-terminus [Cryptosporidium felis]